MAKLSVSWGRDYATLTRYEWTLFNGETLIERQGGFMSSTAAKRAGVKRLEQIGKEESNNV